MIRLCLWYNVAMKKAARRARNRSGKFPCDICGKNNILDEHHIEGRTAGNGTNNLTAICQTCHRRVHEGEVIIEGWFETTGGRTLFHYVKDEKSFTGESKSTYIIPK